MRPRKALAIKDEPSKFTVENLFAMAKDLKSGRVTLDKLSVSDEMQVGLRAVIRKSGVISLHAAYTIGESRPLIRLGDLDKRSEEYISIDDARALTKTIQYLADRGIDVQEGLHRRLVRELREQGNRWRPEK